MAVRESVKSNGAGNGRAWFVAACLLVLFVAALFLRAYWNLDAAHPAEGEFVLSGGSDPYYHKRAVDSIQDNGFRHLIDDPLLNYPIGAENPNPPLYEWFIAVGGLLMDPLLAGDLAQSTWMVTLWSPAILGALTVFPIYFIGAILFDRRAGLIAALLWTVSTSALDATGLGLADHDAMVLFFVTLAFLFYIQTIRHFRGDGHWIQRWSDGGAIGTGFGRIFRERSTGFGYAALTALAIAGVGLTWKGFNYVIGIIFLYACIQMVADHWRNRDSTGLFLGTLVALVLGVVLAYPYYASANVANFLQPTWYILAAFLVAGIVLVPTRDLPTILVMPAALVVALLAGLVAFFVFPTVAQSLLYATVYFKQTRLYETIAEAHPADFSTIAFGIGPLAFFLAIAGWFVLLFRVAGKAVQASIATVGFLTLALVAYVLTSPIAEGTLALPIVGIILFTWLLVMFSLGDTPIGRMHAFAIIWAAVALFMAQSAVRFLINAIPVFAVFAAFMAVWLLDWLDFGAIRKSLAANRGNSWQGLRKGTRPLHVVAVVLIALLFVFPTTMLAADAALPPESENKYAQETDSSFVRNFFTERMGAYGGGFGSVKPWIPALEWLDQHDANITNEAERPAFLSWWDYGHWAIAIGNHPAVADNFQNGYELAANFILSQDEAHAIQLMAARTAEAPGADLQAALAAVNSSDPAADAATIAKWEKANLTIEQSADLLAKVEEQTGKKIRYVAFDIRMLPYDNPQTSSVDQSSIFYAPVTLKGDKPDDYVATMVAVQGAPRTSDPDGDGYINISAYEELARDPIRQWQASAEQLQYQQAFFDSMYYRGYVGTPVQQGEGATTGAQLEAAVNNPRPGFGLQHFRAVYMGDVTRLYRGGDPAEASSYIYYPEIVILEYTPGAIVEGTVTEEGQPLSGVTVVAYDDAGTLLRNAFQADIDAAEYNVPHSQSTTGADGAYRVRAPFALPGGNITIVATREGVEVGRATVDVTREDAAVGKTFPGVAITVRRGSVEGTAFFDDNGDGRFNETDEQVAPGVNLTIGGVSATTGADGKYRVDDVSAGTQNVTTDSANWTVGTATSRVRVQPGETVQQNVSLEARAATVAGELVADLDGNGTIEPATEGVEFTSISFTADANVTGNKARTVAAFSEPGGNYSIQLQPGAYVVTASYTDRATNATYSLSDAITVAAGEAISGRQLVMTRDAETTA